MIGVDPGVKIFLCVTPTDMRKSFDGLSGLVTTVVQQDPLSGHLFVFRNRNRDRLKILYWDRDGLAVWYKRLERGTFQLPTDLLEPGSRPSQAQITYQELSLLLGGIDLGSVKKRKRYQHQHSPQ